MRTAGGGRPGADRWRRRLSSRLWIIAAALAAITLYSMSQVVHGTFQRRNAVHVIAGSAALQVVNHVAARFESRATETFAPVAPWRRAPASTDARLSQALDSLVAEQRAGIVCDCRELLPVRAFVAFDLTRRTLLARTVAGDDALADSVRRAFARIASGLEGPVGARPTRLHGDAMVGDELVITRVQGDANGNAVVVYGLIGDAREITAALFRRLRLTTVRFGDTIARDGAAAYVDAANAPLWIEVRAKRGSGERQLWLDSSTAGELRSTVGATGALQGLSVTAGLPSSRLARVLPVHIQIRELWLLAALLLATALVTSWAFGAAQRETSLAHARSDFIAGVSHDLRMPLAQILLAGETLLLRRERSEAERGMLVRSIVREAQWLAALVENVLLFSRSGAVKLAPHLTAIDAAELLAETRDGVALAVEDAAQSIELRVDGAAMLLGDRTLLRQALTNLVDNAIKYGKPGQSIVLAAERDTAAVVRLVVEDDGAGVPRDERRRVFEPYARLARDQGSERTGTGLGLSVVRQIAEACRGRTWIEESSRGGTRAVIELPAAEGGRS